MKTINKTIWKRPKYLINNVLTYVATILILFSFLAVFIFLFRYYYGLPLTTIDLGIPNYYSNKISTIHKQINETKNKINKINKYKLLLKELHGITYMHTNYPLFKEANVFILDKLVFDGEIKKAEEFSYNWQSNYPFDFDAKFKYAEILEINNKEEMIKYYQNLYDEFTNVNLVVTKYVDVLLKTGEFDLALSIAERANKNNIIITNPIFILDIKDYNNKVGFMGTIQINREDFTKSNGNYDIHRLQNIINLGGIRFSILQLREINFIKNLSFSIKTDNEIFKNLKTTLIQLSDANNITNVLKRSSPQFEIELPDKLKGYTGDIEFNISIKIQNDRFHSLNKIFNHPKWHIQNSNNDRFDNIKPIKFSLTKENNVYKSDVHFSKSKLEYIKVSFPPFVNFKISKFNVTIGGVFEAKFKTIEAHDFKRLNDDEFLLSGLEPYIVLQFNKIVETNKLILEFDINNNDN